MAETPRTSGKPFRGYEIEAAERYAFTRQLISRLAAPGCAIVEFGAAPGHQATALAAEGYDVTAVDLGEAEWTDRPPGALEAFLAEGGVRFVRWDLDNTPYPLDDASFDVALLTEVLEHLREYPAQSLVEIARVIRPGGILVVTTPNAAYVRQRIRLLLGRSVHTPIVDWMFGLPHARHAREYTFPEVERLLRHAGLEPIIATSRHFYRAGGGTGRVALLAKALVSVVARIRPTLGPTVVVVARKPSV